MGKHLVANLSSKGDFQVYVTSRKNHSPEGNAQYLQGDAHNEAWISSVLSEGTWDAVVDFMVYSTEEFKARVDLLLNATKQYVYISSARVYADCGDEELTETSPRLLDVCKEEEYLKTDEYALAKARQEDILINSGRRNWTIVRPSKTYGGDRIQLGSQETVDWLYEAAHSRAIVISKDIVDKYVTFSSGADVAKCLVELIGNDNALGEVFNITNGQYIKWRDVLNAYITVLEESINAHPVLIMPQVWEPWQGGNRYQVKYSTSLNRKVSNAKLLSFFPDLKFEDTVDGVKHNLQEYLLSTVPPFDFARILSKAKFTGVYPCLREVPGKRKKLKLLLHKIGLI